MKKLYAIGLALAVALAFVGMYFSQTTSTYSNAKLGIEFTYRTGPDGYVIQEHAPANDREDLVGAIVVMRAEDAAREMPVDSEGPATITIQVLNNSKKQQSKAWAQEHTIYSNINLRQGEVREYVLGGANAIRYAATGLYESDNVVVAHGENVYVVTGNYFHAESDIRKDFVPLLESISFIPKPGQN